MTLLHAALWVLGSTFVNALIAVYWTRSARAEWRQYHQRQRDEFQRRSRLGVHARRVRVPGAAGGVAIGTRHDDDRPGTPPRAIQVRSLPVTLVDDSGRSLELAADRDLYVHDLPGAIWTGSGDFELLVEPEQPFYVLAEESRESDDYRHARPASIALVPHPLRVANPWIPLDERAEIAADPRDFDLELRRHAPFPVLLYLAVTLGVLIAAAAAPLGALMITEAMILFFSIPGQVFQLPLLRRAPYEPEERWTVEVRA